MSDFIEIALPNGAVTDRAGNLLPYSPVTLKILGTSTDVTHVADIDGSDPDTGGLMIREDGSVGTSTERRYYASGERVLATVEVNGVEQEWVIGASSPSVETRVAGLRVNVGEYVSNFAPFATPIDKAISVAEDNGGGTVEVPEDTYDVSAALSTPPKVYVEGHGPETIIRCTGDNYGFALTGSFCGVSNLRIDAGATGSGTAQSAGGGIDWTNAGGNTEVHHIQFGSYLKTPINLAPDTVTAVHRINDIRVNGELDLGTIFKIGDGTNLITDITIGRVDVTGSAADGSDIERFMDVARKVDTLVIDGKVLCIKALEGIRLGSVGATGAVTGMAADFLVLDQVAGAAIDAVNVVDVTFGESCMVQTCGSSTVPAVKTGSGVVKFSYLGTIRQSGGDGGWVADGSRHVRFDGWFYDNNTSNTANLSGVRVEANADFFYIAGWFGNTILSTGHQKHGWRIESGNSNQFQIGPCFHYRNETSPVSDGSTGQIKMVTPPVAIDAAGTAAVAVDATSMGDLYVRSIAAVERVRLDNSGFINVIAEFAANYLLRLNATSAHTGNMVQFQRNGTLKSAINSQGEFVSDDTTKGIVLKSPNAHYWRETIDDAGAVAWTDLGTTRPD